MGIFSKYFVINQEEKKSQEITIISVNYEVAVAALNCCEANAEVPKTSEAAP